MNMEKKERYIELLERFMQGISSMEEEQELLNGLREPDFEMLLSDYYRMKWEACKSKSLDAETQCRMFVRIKEQIEGKTRMEQTRQVNFPMLRRWWKQAVAAVLIGCIGGLSVYGWMAISKQEEQHFVVSADCGQRSHVLLPDGTEVWLNSHTQLSYTTDYGKKERRVDLEGEAYFEVAKDKEHRFVVRAGGMDVEALGTTFNVKAYKEDKTLTTTLLEGKVRTTIGQKEAILYPDQQVEYNKEKGTLQVSRPENAAYASMWRHGELAFSGETLEEIASLFQRLYNVEVRFDSDKIKQYRFSGVIKNNSLENVIELISLTAPIEYVVKKDTIVLSEKR